MGENIFQLILEAGLVVKGVMIILLLFSIFSWAIIFYKYSFLSKINKESTVFLKIYRRSKNPQNILPAVKDLTLSPLVTIFRELAVEATSTDKAEMRRLVKRLEALEASHLERYLTFLATTGATTPFIGLFGTVWGIMNAFRGIGRAGSASLAVVAPGIAEALITTAAGLAAAIPAVIAYNYYLSRVRRIIVEVEDISQEFVDYFMQAKGVEA